MTERTIETQGVRDSDVQTWLRAFRHSRTFDLWIAIQRLIDWQQLRPSALEPAFYLHTFYVLAYLNSTPRNPGYAAESNKWLGVCRENRQVGQRGWGYEWLRDRAPRYGLVHFTDLAFDPVATIRGFTPEHNSKLDILGRASGTVTHYRGPQQALVDLGHQATIRFTPLTKIVKDDEGKRASLYVSFTYDGPVGWDAAIDTG